MFCSSKYIISREFKLFMILSNRIYYYIQEIYTYNFSLLVKHKFVSLQDTRGTKYPSIPNYGVYVYF